MSDITLFVAFFAGLFSFAAPCVVFLIPGFMTYLGTRSSNKESSNLDMPTVSILFVLGFTVTFALMGVLLHFAFQSTTIELQRWLSYLGGALIIFFGLQILGLFQVTLFNFDTRLLERPMGPFAIGVAFAIGWIPCVSASLGLIFGIALTRPAEAFYLLIAYGLGMGTPFLLIGFFSSFATKVLLQYGNAIRYSRLVFAVGLIGFGLLIFTQKLTALGSSNQLFNLFLFI